METVEPFLPTMPPILPAGTVISWRFSRLLGICGMSEESDAYLTAGDFLDAENRLGHVDRLEDVVDLLVHILHLLLLLLLCLGITARESGSPLSAF